MPLFFRQIGNIALRGSVFGAFAALSLSGVVYAFTYNWADPSALRWKISGAPLQSSQWNLLVGNVDNLNERLSNAEGGGITPSGAIMAFNLPSCPTGWGAADGWGGRPDLRGEFIRGLDGGRWADSGRTLGSWQGDALKDHTHYIKQIGATNVSGGSMNIYGPGWAFADVTSSISGWGWTETRPRNVAFLYCVKN